MKKFALLLANVLAVVGLAVLTIKLFLYPAKPESNRLAN